jgi:hypothetical protein
MIISGSILHHLVRARPPGAPPGEQAGMIMRRSFPVLSLIVLLTFPVRIEAGDSAGEIPDIRKPSQYRYEAIVVGTHEKEQMEMEFTPTNQGLEYYSRRRWAEGSEEVRIQMDPLGQFVRGTRTEHNPEGPGLEEKIWRIDGKAYWERRTAKETKTKEYKLSPGIPLAVNGSILVLLQSFPFYSGKEWDVLVIDFSSSYSITVTIRQMYREKVTVPAGEFDCYRMEITVNVPILRPKIIYWLSTEAPNFVVKQEGKNGPFTPYYVTSLISFR